MSTLQIEAPDVFSPLLAPARYKGAWGGRGSGKSWFFAWLMIARFLRDPKTRAVCVREFQKSLEQSVKTLLEQSIKRMDVGHRFRILDTHIETPEGGLILFQGMATHTAESIKSLEAYDIAWVEEAQSLSQRSLDLLRPTIRAEGSELWFSWNPRYESDPIDAFLRKDPPTGAVVVKATYLDNPWFPSVLEQDVQDDLRRDKDKYAHVWGGEYERRSKASVFKNWRIGAREEFTGPPDHVFEFGADWGFSEDPSVLVRSYAIRRNLYIDREVYRIGCEIDHTPWLFDSLLCGCFPEGDIPDGATPDCRRDGHGFARRWPIIADSARPETISYMRRHGYPKIRHARKGPNSVEEGIKFLQNFDIIVHPDCAHAISELTMYRYKTDRMTDAVLPVLEDKKNHVIDALRYSVEARRLGSGFAFGDLPGL